MGSQVIGVIGFLPANIQLATPFCSRLRSGTGQTDRWIRQTTAINALCPHL